jgi:hypothetical protein
VKKKKDFVEVRQVGAQGDVLMRRVDSLPSEAVSVQPENSLLIVTHSETGHHHAVQTRSGIELFQNPQDPLVGWLKIKKEAKHADVVHHRPWDTHQTQRLLYSDTPNGEVIFEIRRQRENSPEGWRRVED